MTRKLYQEDPYMRQFEATVEAFEYREDCWHIRLDQTAFYPEGGGQPSDQGTLDDAAVSYVYEKNGRIWHVADQQFQVGQKVAGAIHWGRRFHFMQQHLGQHILSAIFLKEFDAKTVSVHFGVETSSLDLDLPLTPEQVTDAELMANDAVYRNIPVDILYPSPSELAEKSRKIPETHGEPLRIVQVGDLDYTACCGTHCRTTGEVGLIKLFKPESYKGGLRIGFACGGAAFVRYRQLYGTITQMQQLLSVAEGDIAERTQRLLEEVAALRKERQALMDRLLAAEAEKMVEAASPVGAFHLVCEVMYDTTPEDMRGLFFHLTQRPGVVAVLGGVVPAGAMLMMGTYRGERRVDVRSVFNQSLAYIGGRGGGNAVSCQGMGPEVGRLSEVVSAAGLVMEELLERVSMSPETP